MAITIRPHHGMCLTYFRGKGYSEGFTKNMQDMKDKFEADPQVRLVVQTDEICSACPNNKNGICKSAEHVEHYDRAVIENCGLKENQELSFLDFSKSVQEKIIEAGKRPQICGDCQWDYLCR